MTTLPNPTQPRGRRRSATVLLDELTGEDHAALQRTVNAARKTTDHRALADLFRTAVVDSGERARAETGMFLAMFRERDAEGAERFFETFKARAGAQEADRIRQVAEFQAARDRAAAQAQLAQATPAPAQPPQPKPAGSGRPRDDGRNPNFTRFRQNLKPREGGFANRGPKVDIGGPTQKGVSQRFLNSLNRQNPQWGLPKVTGNLTDDQIDGIYRIEFFDKPNIQKVADIPGLQGQAPKLAEQLFDSGVLHGTVKAGKFLQQSLDQVLGTDLRVTDAQGRKANDGIVGSETRAAIARAVRDGRAAAVNDVMVSNRLAFMRTLPILKNNPGWIPRAESFKTGTP